MIVLFPDVHLGGSLRMSCEELRKDSMMNLRNAVEKVFQLPGEPPLAVVFAGDIFHRNRISGLEIDAFMEAALRFANADIQMLFVQGNHDLDRDIPLGEALRYAESLNGNLQTIGGIRLFGLDFQNREQVQKSLSGVPECDLLVMHAGFEHMLNYEGAYEMTLEDIPDRVQNVFAGHVHVRGEHSLPHGTFVSPGSLVACTLRQDGPKGFYTWDGPGQPFIFREVATRPIFTFEYFDTKEDLQKAVATVAAWVPPAELSGCRPILHIRYHANIVNAYREALANCDLSRVLFFETRDGNPQPTTAEPLLDNEDMPETVSMETMLPFVAPVESPQFRLASDMLTYPFPDHAITDRLRVLKETPNAVATHKA